MPNAAIAATLDVTLAFKLLTAVAGATAPAAASIEVIEKCATVFARRMGKGSTTQAESKITRDGTHT